MNAENRKLGRKRGYKASAETRAKADLAREAYYQACAKQREAADATCAAFDLWLKALHRADKLEAEK